MPSFFDLQKFAATGIASADMTAYDKARALAAFGGWKTQTLTDVPPLSFKANGKPLISWSMLGNGQQTRTPTPDAPIMPEFVGVRSANVMPAGEKKTVIGNGVTFESDGIGRYHISGTASSNSAARFNLITGFTTPVSVSNGGRGTLSFFNNQSNGRATLSFYNGTNKVDDWTMDPKNRVHTAYNTIGNKYIDAINITVFAGETVDMMIMPEFTNDGVLPSNFDPYGYKIQIICSGQTTPVYLSEVPTVRRVKKLVLTGNENITMSTTSSFQILGAIQWGSTSGFCTHYQQISWDEATYVSKDGFSLHAASGGADRFRICDRSITTVADFRAYLAQQYANGTPVTIWYVLAEPETAVVNEPLAKIGDYADELHSEDAGVSIPTAKGQNTLTVDTDLQPSSMTIEYRA